jgi:hypothetical protein
VGLVELMSLGSLKPLLLMLQAAPSLAGVSVVFGEEMTPAQDIPTPMVVMVPIAGSLTNQPGYIRNVDPSVNMTWFVVEDIELRMWAYSSATNAQPIDHADAVETLRAQVLQALQFQQAPGGLRYIPQRERWDLMQNASIRYGRSLALTVQVEIGIPDVLPTETLVTGLSISATV